MNESGSISKQPSIMLCIVLGFLSTTFSGVEQGPPHLVQVGYQKGGQIARKGLPFDIVYIGGTASKFVAIFNCLKICYLVL